MARVVSQSQPSRSPVQRQAAPTSTPPQKHYSGGQLGHWQHAADPVTGAHGREPGVLDGRVLPRNERPAVPRAGLAEQKDPDQLTAAGRLLPAQRPAGNTTVDPIQPSGYTTPCIACQEERRRDASGRWPEASHEIELRDLQGNLRQAQVCAGHVAVAQRLGVLVAVRELVRPQLVRLEADGIVVFSTGPPRAAVSSWQPNPTLEISGDYSGQLAASLSTAARWPRPSRRRSLPA